MVQPENGNGTNKFETTNAFLYYMQINANNFCDIHIGIKTIIYIMSNGWRRASLSMFRLDFYLM